jgi:hypothetical protein
MKRSLVSATLAVVLLTCVRVFAAEPTLRDEVIDRIDRYVLAFAEKHKGNLSSFVGDLVQNEMKGTGIKLTSDEWKAIAARLDEDLERLRQDIVDELPPAVYELNFASMPAPAPFEWSKIPDELLLIFRGYDVNAVAGLASSAALPTYLSASDAFARESLVWGFTSSDTFMAKIDGREALGLARGNWIATTTFSRTPNGLIKPEIVRLHKRY